jgi:hypothetical protein
MEAGRQKPSANIRGLDLFDMQSELRVVLDGHVTDLRGVLLEYLSNDGVDLTECEEIGDREVGDDVDQELRGKPSQMVVKSDRHCWWTHGATVTGV